MGKDVTPTEKALGVPPVTPLLVAEESEYTAELPQDAVTRKRVIQMMIDLVRDADAGLLEQAVHSLGMMEDERGRRAGGGDAQRRPGVDPQRGGLGTWDDRAERSCHGTGTGSDHRPGR